MMGQPASLQGHILLIAKDTYAHHAITQSPRQIIKAIAYLPTLRKIGVSNVMGHPVSIICIVGKVTSVL